MYRIHVVALYLLVGAGQLLGQAELVIEATEHARLYGEDNLYGESYGRRIAMHADRMVTVGYDQAVVWRHQLDSWWPGTVIRPGIGYIADVGFDGDRIVFGAPLAPYGQDWPIDGRVSVWQQTGLGWAEDATWSQPGNALTGYEVHSFGSSVDIDGDVIVVGAPDSRETNGDVDGPGHVFVYTLSGGAWQLADWTTSFQNEPDQFFGASVDFDVYDAQGNGTLIVGAPKEGTDPGQRGAAYVFEWDGADLDQVAHIHPQIELTDPFVDDDFGIHVANDQSMYMIIAADGYAGIVEEDPGSPGDWIGQTVMLPDRQTSRFTDGVDFDAGLALYVDSAADEVIVMQRISGVWQERTHAHHRHDDHRTRRRGGVG